MKWNSISVLYVATVLLSRVLGDLGNPYQILGVHTKASQQEIRQAYKQLAREWHPDKSKLPQAEERFVEISKAYELLSDPERRILYDRKGITEDDAHRRTERSAYFNSFDDLFSQHGSHFNFQQDDITFFHKLSITANQYYNIVLPRSETTPYLMFFYTDWCFSCIMSAPHCRKLKDNLEPLGINFVTVHSAKEAELSSRYGVSSVPFLMFVIEGRTFAYKGKNILNVAKIIEFVKSKFPYKLVSSVGEDNLDEFLNGWTDNRVRGLIVSPKTGVRLRYLTTAFRFRHRVAFGVAETDYINERFMTPRDMDTVLLFNENVSTPVASISMKDIPTTTLHNIISSNQFLALPRLSSQSVLEELCPCAWNKPKMKICAALVTDDSTDHDPHRLAFRQYAEKFPYGTERVRFTYIYHQRQSLFINALRKGSDYTEPVLRVVVFWRLDTSRVKYEWAPVKWEIEGHLNNSHEKLAATITRLLKSTESFAYEAYVTDLLDEHAVGLIKKIITRVYQYFESIHDSLGRQEALAALTVAGTFVMVFFIGYLMINFAEKEEEKINEMKAKRATNNNNNNSTVGYNPELKLYEMRSEKYNGLVRLLKPGCRTILLILDMQSRQQLIPPYHRAVWPYRKNKTLHFAYMYIERGLTWYKELLQLSLFKERELNINPRNCVGTVLSLNGHRKYFCVFHAKHTESRSKAKIKTDASKPNEKDCESGAFIGFNSDESESESEEVLLQGSLLDGLPNWLDRLFEGTTQRYHINYWPEFPIK